VFDDYGYFKVMMQFARIFNPILCPSISKCRLRIIPASSISFAHYMQAYSRAGWKAMQYNRLKALSALYWYTVEFGLLNTDQGMRIYGAGILSSAAESPFALKAKSPNRIHLNVDRVMRTEYKIDDLQQSYFVIDNFQNLDFNIVAVVKGGNSNSPKDNVHYVDNCKCR
jgi:hypothetical protein